MYFVNEQIRQIVKQLDSLRYRTAAELGTFEYVECGYKINNTPPQGPWKPFPAEQSFGGKDKHFWFHKQFHSPLQRLNKSLFFDLRTSEGNRGWDAIRPQGLVYLNGEMVQGLDLNHRQVLLKADMDYDMYIYFYSGMEARSAKFLPRLLWLDEPVDKLYYDIKVALDAAECLPEGSEQAWRILQPLERTVRLIDLRQPCSEAFYESLHRASELLQQELYQSVCGSSTAIVDCVGHTHIDVAWMWTLEQTREKVQRSFSTVLRLMEQYPEYIFMSSQPQLYQYIKESAPELYDQIKERVKQGRWEVEGAMWLEADCNLPSGESLIRQLLYGKQFIKDEFGVESTTLWLPDVFGYSAALPQILKKSGIKRFFTSKISWSETNRMPYESFLWQGIDGTEIFTSFATAQDASRDGTQENFVTYNGNTEPRMVLGAWERYTDKNYTDEVMITFGYGDGGGGPTRHQLETQRRMEAGFPGFPKTRITTANAYFNSIERKFHEACKKTGRTPRWVGELYLEFHRGTYTSIAKNKRNNRKSELLYQSAEIIAVLDQLMGGLPYPKDELHHGWKTILLNQFHDIIPGSSIFEVYEESDRQYKEVLEQGSRLVEKRLCHLADQVSEAGYLVYNPLGFSRSGFVTYGGKETWVENIPALGWKVVSPEARPCRVIVDAGTLENDYVRIQLDECGFIVSLLDKRVGRELVKKGQRLNELQVFEDFPKDWDAWEITCYYKQKSWLIDRVVEMTPVDEGEKKGIRIKWEYMSSTVTQTVYLSDHSAQIDFVTEVDWHERHQLLKAAFPLDIHANEATYEIQFGHLKRPTHSNTSWDAAKFEVCGHKWADLAEEGYGVSLLNDCKYGYSAEGSTLKLTLLKCATHPNPEADQGHHVFTYALLPHLGSFKESGTIEAAYALNQPFLGITAAGRGALPKEFGLVSCDCPNVIVETVKAAEDGDGLIIRLYEAYGRRDLVRLRFGLDIDKAELCDMMERKLEDTQLNVIDHQVALPIRGFEIITLRCKLRNA